MFDFVSVLSVPMAVILLAKATSSPATTLSMSTMAAGVSEWRDSLWMI